MSCISCDLHFPFHNMPYLLWQRHIFITRRFCRWFINVLEKLTTLHILSSILTHTRLQVSDIQEKPQFVHWPSNGPLLFPTIFFSLSLYLIHYLSSTPSFSLELTSVIICAHKSETLRQASAFNLHPFTTSPSATRVSQLDIYWTTGWILVGTFVK